MSVSSQPGPKDGTGIYISALAGSNWKARWQAAQALGESGDSRAVRPLIRALDDSNQWVRIVAAEALGQIGHPDATQALLFALTDDSIWVRRASVVALGQIGNTQSIHPLLERLLSAPNNEWPEELRDAIAKALGAIGGPAIKALINALDDPDAWVSSSAARALGQIGDPKAIVPLTGLIDRGGGWVRTAATQALAQIADARAVRAALSTDEAPRAFWKLMALREINESTVNQLTALLDDPDQQIRTQAAQVLRQLGEDQTADPQVATLGATLQPTPRSRLPLTQSGAGGGPQVQDRAAVGMLEGIGALVSALRDPVVEVRLAAAEALGSAGDASVVSALGQALQDKDSRVRAAAARSMGEIGAKVSH